MKRTRVTAFPPFIDDIRRGKLANTSEAMLKALNSRELQEEFYDALAESNGSHTIELQQDSLVFIRDNLLQLIGQTGGKIKVSFRSSEIPMPDPDWEFLSKLLQQDAVTQLELVQLVFKGTPVINRSSFLQFANSLDAAQSLEYCKLALENLPTGVNVDILMQNIAKSPKLSHLELALLDGQKAPLHFRSRMQAIQAAPRLETLDLSINDFDSQYAHGVVSNEDLNSIADLVRVFRPKKLSMFFGDVLQASPDDYSRLAEAINAAAVERLVIETHAFGPANLNNLIEQLRVNQGLIELTLVVGSIEEIQSLATYLANNKALQRLEITAVDPELRGYQHLMATREGLEIILPYDWQPLEDLKEVYESEHSSLS